MTDPEKSFSEYLRDLWREYWLVAYGVGLILLAAWVTKWRF